MAYMEYYKIEKESDMDTARRVDGGQYRIKSYRSI